MVFYKIALSFFLFGSKFLRPKILLLLLCYSLKSHWQIYWGALMAVWNCIFIVFIPASEFYLLSVKCSILNFELTQKQIVMLCLFCHYFTDKLSISTVNFCNLDKFRFRTTGKLPVYRHPSFWTFGTSLVHFISSEKDCYNTNVLA